MTDVDELARALARVLVATDIEGLRRLSGGASRETWAFDADGRALVLQRERPGGVRRGGMATEAALLAAARAEGVPVPAVVATDADGPASAVPGAATVAGQPRPHPERGAGDASARVDHDLEALGPAWMVVDRVEGETIARRILRDDAYADARPKLAAQCGDALARIHRIDPTSVPGLAGGDQVALLRGTLDGIGEPHPAFELAFRWLEAHRPPPPAGGERVVHGDFRNGNLIVGPDGLRAVLDWELAHTGDPIEDLGWLCVRAWRFGAAPRVGGFGTVDDLVAAYETTAGRPVDRAALHWWEVLGTLKWGIICAVQAATHLTGVVRSVELAAIGRRVCEVEHDLGLLLPGPDPDEAADGATGAGAAGGGPHDAPSAGQLVEAVREYLEGDVAAATEGRVRFHARVAARVLATVERELAAGDGPARAHAARLRALGMGSEAELAAAIRSGAMDDRWDEVTRAVRATVADKLAVANPDYAAAGT